jgi:hypothetical protein
MPLSNLQNRGGITSSRCQQLILSKMPTTKTNVDFVITLPIFIMQLLGVDKALSQKMMMKQQTFTALKVPMPASRSKLIKKQSASTEVQVHQSC